MKNKKTTKTILCPFCGKVMSKEEIKMLYCSQCKNYLVLENNVIRMPKYIDETDHNFFHVK
jgi:phage FluMu protein Com